MAPPVNAIRSISSVSSNPEHGFGAPSPDNDDEPIVAPDDTVINVDAATGAVTHDGPDGDVIISFPGAAKARKKRTSTSFDDNLALDLDDSTLASIAMQLMLGIEGDIEARRDWEETANKAVDYLGVTLEEATSQVAAGGTVAKTHHTMMIEALIKDWAAARAELLPTDGPVKVRDDLPPDQADEPGLGHNGGPPLDSSAEKPRRSQLADDLQADMNHYLTSTDRGYYPDYSKMLVSRALIGNAFRKVYRCPIARRPLSRWVMAQNLIISNEASHLMDAARVTERMKMRQSTVRRMMVNGHWRDVPLGTAMEMVDETEKKIGEIQGIDPMPRIPADYRHEIFENYSELDDGILAEDENGKLVGYPLPYRITLCREGPVVLEIRRNWKQGDKEYKARRRYVKYGFIPGLGFYDWGLIHLVGNAQRACTAIERILIDAGMYSNMPGGFMARGPTRQTTTDIRPSPGQWVPIDTGGLQRIQDAIMPFPYKEPSQVLMALGQSIASDARKLVGTIELPVGEGRVGDVPVGTIMAFVESISMVPGAVHKDDHISQLEEFELLKELFEEEPEALSQHSRDPKRQWTTKDAISDQSLVPASDPNTPSQIHRIMQVTALIQAAQMQIFQGIPNFRGLWARVLEVLKVERASDITNPPGPAQAAPPDPKIEAAKLKAQTEQGKTIADMQKAADDKETKLAEIAADSAARAGDRQAGLAEGAMKLAGTKIQNQHADAQHLTGLIADHAKHQSGIASEHFKHVTGLAQDDAHHSDDMAQADADREQQGLTPPDSGDGS